MLVEMSSGSLFLSGVVCLVAYYYLRDGRTQRRDDRLAPLPNNPPCWPILGNFLIFAAKNAAKEITKLREAYGSVVLLKLAGKKVVVIQDYKLVKEALVVRGDKTSGRPRTLFDRTKRLWGEGSIGIVMNEGDPHRIARRFASVGLRDFGVGKQSIEDKITEELEFLIGPLLNAEKVYSSVEFKEQTQMAMINIMNNILFGQRFSYDHAEFRRIVLAVGTGSSISPMACPENYLPFLKYLPFFHSKLEVFISETERVFNFMEASAESHRDTFDPSNIRDFTDLYLKQVVEQTGDDSNQITPKSAFTSMRDLFLAGGETSATVVEWMQLFLCNTPMTQKKVADEILKVVGVDRQISYSDRKEMPYTEAVINESLRLGNIIPMLLPHTVTESFVLKGRLIPKDSILIINADSIHMDRDYWGDPDVFRPERWLDDDGTLVKHEAFVPFGIGPRNCIGDQVAKKMLFLFLTNFVRQVKVSFPNKETGRSIEGHLGLIYKPEPYEMTITPRLTPLRESISSVSSVSV